MIEENKPKEGINVIIKNNTNKFLLQFRDGKPGLQFPLLWTTFGGGLNPDEDPITGAIRELNEEISLKTQFQDFDIKGYVMFNTIKEWIAYYQKTIVLRDIQELHEGAGLGFFTADEIKCLPLTPIQEQVWKKVLSEFEN